MASRARAVIARRSSGRANTPSRLAAGAQGMATTMAWSRSGRPAPAFSGLTPDRAGASALRPRAEQLRRGVRFACIDWRANQHGSESNRDAAPDGARRHPRPSRSRSRTGGRGRKRTAGVDAQAGREDRAVGDPEVLDLVVAAARVDHRACAGRSPIAAAAHLVGREQRVAVGAERRARRCARCRPRCGSRPASRAASSTSRAPAASCRRAMSVDRVDGRLAQRVGQRIAKLMRPSPPTRDRAALVVVVAVDQQGDGRLRVRQPLDDLAVRVAEAGEGQRGQHRVDRARSRRSSRRARRDRRSGGRPPTAAAP